MWLGQALRVLRLRAGVTQEYVAWCADTTQAQIARVELGSRQPTLCVLRGYARATGQPEAVMRICEAAILGTEMDAMSA
ncbi:helix-turn-helix domain-containing protein [Alicyclobacillus acidocaldarius]|uniref:Transcriptional regulator, XRE family n=1 Tax=Alicyclobacillus acidocaldarius subsp. acidocaldarius (strain ATCC 27009 / DSM 446 / BCRC 14685 / JCM 5260 / KCTC 1825 / NBRC 15652 / NCIMB 11725 / NRRL B-14509 / 104-IA) TaxID=521098 RepID=C8WVI1_ALIAD|nr:helix-turn-helix transcriptional regulator [Alicyclobacillus acidocaldarius]ACV58103.1 transcriptional regulator, XRE family [Alicyclobacillus acidocaldarius subsp. acidocaldarius DSM 446]